MWTFDHNDLDDGGYPTNTFGTGEGSVFVDPDEPDHEGNPRTLLAKMLGR